MIKQYQVINLKEAAEYSDEYLESMLNNWYANGYELVQIAGSYMILRSIPINPVD